jgi:hypothetical protein
MFEDPTPLSRFSMPLFWCQMFVAPVGGLYFGTIFVVIVWQVMAKVIGVGADSVEGDLTGYLTFALTGAALGYGIQRAIPQAAESGGRWVWIPPVCVVVLGVLEELNRDSHGVVGALFVVSHRQWESLGVLFLTWPAVSSCFYSAGIAIASRLAPRALKSSNPPHSL